MQPGAPKSNLRRSQPARYDRHVGNPFSGPRKFSGKTASTRLQIRRQQKGRRPAPFRIPDEPHSRQF
jgi:hypothetical protein